MKQQNSEVKLLTSSKKNVRLARQWRNDRMLVTLSFSKRSSPSLGEPDTCARTQRISQDHGDRQTKRRAETDLRKRQDGRQGRWCGMVHTATRVCVLFLSVLLESFEWWPPPFSSLEVAACYLLPWGDGVPHLRWPRHQGARDTTRRRRHQACRRHRGNRSTTLGKVGQHLCVCSMIYPFNKLNYLFR